MLFLLHNSDNKLIGIITAYVDDMLIVGTDRVILGIKMKLKTKFSMKDLGQLKKLLGVEYKLDHDVSTNKKFWSLSLESILMNCMKKQEL
jgi:hypothetical protein